MFRLMIIISVLLITNTFELIAQQSLKGRFGFGFGYSSGVQFINFENLNKNFLTSNGKGLSDNLRTSGVIGYFYFLILPDTRISLNIFQADKETQLSQHRFLKYEQNFWNIGLEYTFSISLLNISPGIMIGNVTDYIELGNYDGSQNFSDIVQNFNQANTSSALINFENKSIHFSPGICVEYSLSRFIAARISYKYLIRLNEDWKFMRRFSVINFPDNLLTNTHLINFGILIGFMSK